MDNSNNNEYHTNDEYHTKNGYSSNIISSSIITETTTPQLAQPQQIQPFNATPQPSVIYVSPNTVATSPAPGGGHYEYQKYIGGITWLVCLMGIPCALCFPCDERAVWVPAGYSTADAAGRQIALPVQSYQPQQQKQ